MSDDRDLAIYGHFGGWNAGDEIILESVVNAVRLRRPGATIDVISSGFHPTALERYAELDVRPVRLRSAACLASLRQRRLIAGGGQMMTGDVSLKGLVALLLLTSISRLSGGRPVLLSIGTQGLQRRSARLLARTIVTLTTATIVRDRDTFDELSSCGADEARLVQAADIVFNGTVQELAGHQESNDGADHTTSGPTILVVLHWSSMRELVSASAGEALLRHLETAFPDSRIVVQSHDRRMNFDDGGVLGLEALGRWTRVVFERFDGLDPLLANYQSADVVVSARMHPLIISTVLGTPSVTLRGSRKTKALSERIGLPLGDIEEVDELIELIAKALANGAPAWHHLQELVDESIDQHLISKK